MPAFQLSGLSPVAFEPLFALSDEELRNLGAVRQVATGDFGFPCRIGLLDAQAGEELLLLPYEHQAAATPYRASGPVFVRRGARQCTLPPGVVPPYVAKRLISWRAYDDTDLMIDAAVCEGTRIGTALEQVFANPAVAYVHLHNAKRGCYSCLASRVA